MQIHFHVSEIKKNKIINLKVFLKELRPMLTVIKNVKWWGLYGKQYDISLEIKNIEVPHGYFMSQQSTTGYKFKRFEIRI